MQSGVAGVMCVVAAVLWLQQLSNGLVVQICRDQVCNMWDGEMDGKVKEEGGGRWGMGK